MVDSLIDARLRSVIFLGKLDLIGCRLTLTWFLTRFSSQKKLFCYNEEEGKWKNDIW